MQSKENNERKSETLKESNTEKCNIERVKYKESATWKECSMKRTQHEKVQHESNAT